MFYSSKDGFRQGVTKNQELIQYHTGRRVWLVELDETRPKPSRLPDLNAVAINTRCPQPLMALIT